MKAHKPDDVLARVVAWHNRHPLAQRIKPSQVHGIGEVRLPFASDRPADTQAAALPPPPLLLHELTDELPPELARKLRGDQPATLAAAKTPAKPAVASEPIAGANSQATVVDQDAAPTQIDDGTEIEFVMAGEPDPAASAESTASQPATAAGKVDPLHAVDREPANDTPPVANDAATPAPAASSLASRLQAARDAAMSVDADDADARARLNARADTSPSTATPWWRRLFKRTRPTHPGQLRPLFSQRLIWPISPKQVASWARKHGTTTQVAPADWPFRQVKAEPALVVQNRTKGLGHRVQLHMLTAAIGVQDRRMRVLVDNDGHVLGPRAYDRKRVTLALGTLVLGLGGLAFQALRPAPDSDLSTQMAAAAPSLASATIHEEQAVSAPDAADAALTPDIRAAALSLAAASATHPTAPDGGLDKATTAAAGMVSAAPPSPRRDLAVVFAPPSKPGPDGLAAAQNRPQMQPSPVHQPDLAHAPTAATGAVAATAADIAASNAAWARASGLFAPERAATAAAAPRPTDGSAARASPPLAKADASIVTTTPPPSFPERHASGPVAQIRPELSEQQRQQARDSSQAARQAASSQAETAQRRAGVKDSPRFAVVAEGSGQRDLAEARLAQMKSVRAQIPAPAPAHSELVQQQGLWHAALWPFGSPAEAERARAMLGTRGLKAEVVSF